MTGRGGGRLARQVQQQDCLEIALQRLRAPRAPPRSPRVSGVESCGGEGPCLRTPHEALTASYCFP